MKLVKKEVGKYSYGITDYGYCARAVYERKVILWRTLTRYFVCKKQGQFYLGEDNGWNSLYIFDTKEEAEHALEEAITYGTTEPADPYFKFTPIK